LDFKLILLAITIVLANPKISPASMWTTATIKEFKGTIQKEGPEGVLKVCLIRFLAAEYNFHNNFIPSITSIKYITSIIDIINYRYLMERSSL
jgi:hypothetical protein